MKEKFILPALNSDLEDYRKIRKGAIKQGGAMKPAKGKGTYNRKPKHKKCEDLD